MAMMDYLKLSVLVLLFYGKSFGLSISVSGASSFVQDATTTTNVTVYAGYALPDQCETKDNVSTCNSCRGLMITDNGITFPAPCNQHSIYSTLALTISVSSDQTNINGLSVGASSTASYSDGQITTITNPVVNGKNYSFSATWADVITALSSSSSGSGTFNITDCPTSCGGTKTLYFGPIKDSAFIEKIAVTINLSYVDYASASSMKNVIKRSFANVCPPRSATDFVSDYSSVGFCYYEMVPGDEKAYITNNIPGWGSSPKDADSGINYSQLVMYYVERATGAGVLETLRTVANNSPNAVLNITDKAEDPLSEYKITGLENDKSYCFLPAIKDMTGNIQYFLDIQTYNGTTVNGALTNEQMELLCATPSEVTGVLGDKSCFIATATFGSAVHPYLDILRSFRDQVLLKLKFGKKFVKWYYTNGPIGANWIEQNPEFKPIIRVLLMPVIGTAYMVLNYPVLLGLGLLLILGFLYSQRLRKKLQLIAERKKQKYFLLFVLFLSLNFPQQVRAQEDALADEFMETPTEAPTKSQEPAAMGDVPPNEPPYVKSQDQIEADKMVEVPLESEPPTPAVQQQQSEEQAAVKEEENKVVVDEPVVDSKKSKDRYKIAHPDAAKGLYLIDQNTGKYYYKVDKKAKKNQTTSIRMGLIDPPNIEGSTNENTFSFVDMYGEDTLPYLLLDYEWQPFTRFGKLGVILGMGFFTASGNGVYVNDQVTAAHGEARESYTFIGLPISAGGIYRFQFGNRQWVAPFVNAGLSYYVLAEIRDDGKKPAVVGTPAGYGGGGLMFNITAWDRDIAFTMDREYNISNMWLTAEYKYVQSLNEDLDISSSIFNIGISVDY
jgi:hypothetical protein